MRILLLGANGQVGHELRRSLAETGEVIAATRGGDLQGVRCEIADFDSPESLPPLIQRIAPDVVINAAAYTQVDKAEDDKDVAFRVNAEGPARLADACASRGIQLIHYSTDYVFNGQAARPYREEDPTDPLGVYGASKRAGEEAIIASGCRHLIFRTAWVYGNHGANFMRTMLRLGAERSRLRVVADQFGTPTPAFLIADVTVKALQALKERSGLWHLTAAGITNWHGFAEEIFRQAFARGLLRQVPEVEAITSAEYPTRARRPAYSCLETSRLSSDLGLAFPEWQSALSEVLDAVGV